MLAPVSSTRPVRPFATASDLAALADDAAPSEIVGGQIVEKAAPTPEHGSAQFALSGLLFSPFGSSRGPGGPGGWWLMTEVEVEYGAHEVYRHDHVGFRRDRVPERPKARPVPTRPDWACEILSPSNASNDTVRKLRTLHRAGVPHYWLIDPERLTLTVLRWTPDGYLEALIATAEETVRAEPFEAIELILAEVFGR
jgi:Uma2 family endonuclease